LIRPFKRFTTLKPGPLRRILREALITGDFFISPKRVIFGLEAVLKDTLLRRSRRLLKDSSQGRNPQMSGLTQEDLLISIKQAMERADYVRLGLSLDEANALHSINRDLMENIISSNILLL
jgi:lipoate-protein ligase A